MLEMTLSEKLKRYKDLKEELDRLEREILKEGEQMLKVGESFTTPFGVALEYSRGRGSYDYEAIANELAISPEAIQAYTKTFVDWTGLVKSLNPPAELLNRYYQAGTPKVKITIKG